MKTIQEYMNININVYINIKSPDKINVPTLSCGSLTEERICIAWIEFVSKK